MNEEIISGNKIIMEFDGWKFSHFVFEGTEDQLPYYEKYDEHGNIIHDGILHIPEYHLSWDALMSVVKKIIDLGWQFQLNCYGVSNDAKFINGENYIQVTAWSTPLLATYNAVIDFLEWYNNNKKD